MAQEKWGMLMMGWGTFGAMIVVSTAIMFPLMYQLAYSDDHVIFSFNRSMVVLVMGGALTVPEGLGSIQRSPY